MKPADARVRIAPIRDRLAGAACYVLPGPLKAIATCIASAAPSTRVHREQAAALSAYLLVALIVLLALDVAAALVIRFHEDLLPTARKLALALVAAVLLPWLAGLLWGIATALLGSPRRCTLASSLGRRRAVHLTSALGWSAVALLALAATLLAAHAARVTRDDPLGPPADLYILYDDGAAPRWAYALAAYPMARAAHARHGPDSVVVAPATTAALARALTHGRVLFLGTHGEAGRVYLPDGLRCSPADALRLAPSRPNLRLAYLTACHGDARPGDWAAALAPARVVAFARWSAVVEHVLWMASDGPAAIRDLPADPALLVVRTH